MGGFSVGPCYFEFASDKRIHARSDRRLHRRKSLNGMARSHSW
jgi:hypothetical protein